jgi:hypothetical protein
MGLVGGNGGIAPRDLRSSFRCAGGKVPRSPGRARADQAAAGAGPVIRFGQAKIRSMTLQYQHGRIE